MKMYKGFDKDLKCRDFQYEIGKTYEELTAELCKKGFHACEYPLDVFKYYAPGNMSRYCEVDLDEVSGKKGIEDSKRCGKKISLKAEINIAGLVKAAVDYTMEKAIPENSEHATGDYGAASATGDYGAASATGCRGAASATGERGAASATGDYGAASATGGKGAASATGDYGAASATGDYGAASATGWKGAASATGDYGAASATGLKGAASATGDYGAASATGWEGAASATGERGAASATGDYGAASATGCRGAASATGDYGAASATGERGVAAALGSDSKAKGALGCWIVLSEWGIDEESNWHRKDVQCFKVDGETVKPNTWYTLKDGRPVEVDE